MSNELLFELRNIEKVFRKGNEEVCIYKGLNLDIYSGDFISVMGPSGSGKTTLLNILGGVDRPSNGEVKFFGEPINLAGESKMSKWRARHVGFIFQFYNLMPVLTAAENIELPLLLTNLQGKERKKRVDSVLDLVGLSERSKHKPGELSGGQQQRVAIARAIISDPDVLLCDEPTGDLDREGAEKILGILKLLNEDFKKTIVMVTHDSQAAEYANRRLKTDKGSFFEQEN